MIKGKWRTGDRRKGRRERGKEKRKEKRNKRSEGKGRAGRSVWGKGEGELSGKGRRSSRWLGCNLREFIHVKGALYPYNEGLRGDVPFKWLPPVTRKEVTWPGIFELIFLSTFFFYLFLIMISLLFFPSRSFFALFSSSSFSFLFFSLLWCSFLSFSALLTSLPLFSCSSYVSFPLFPCWVFFLFLDHFSFFFSVIFSDHLFFPVLCIILFNFFLNNFLSFYFIMFSSFY